MVPLWQHQVSGAIQSCVCADTLRGALRSCTSSGSPQLSAAQAAGMQPPALRTEWPNIRTHPASDWSKINVITLPRFPMQRHKKSRFLRSPATSLHYNSTGWFPSGVLRSPFPAAQDSLENESWILIRQPIATNINVVILKGGWNFVVFYMRVLRAARVRNAASSAFAQFLCEEKHVLRLIAGNLQLSQQIWGEVHYLSCDTKAIARIFCLSARNHCRWEREPQLLVCTCLQS